MGAIWVEQVADETCVQPHFVMSAQQCSEHVETLVCHLGLCLCTILGIVKPLGERQERLKKWKGRGAHRFTRQGSGFSISIRLPPSTKGGW